MRNLVLVFSFFAIFASMHASAYVLSTNSSGTVTRWPGGSAAPTFQANWNNKWSLTYTQIFNSFTDSLQRWKNIGSANIGFDYYQGGSSPAYYGYDGINAVFFSSQSTQKLGSSTIGVTYVYSSGSDILETDVEFNDDTFQFTVNPTDSSQWGGGTRVYLENVATHEFGHAYGLSHSAVLQSSMVYLEDRGQYKPSCDDIQGLAADYPSLNYSTARGNMTGTVTGVFGAHVLAISKTRGSVVEGAISQSDGSFTLTNLEPGDYYLMVEPFQTTSPISSLCGGSATGCSYGTVNSQKICTGASKPFKRMFVETSDGIPTKFTVTAGGTTAVAAVTVGCVAMTAPAWNTNYTAGTALSIASFTANAGAEVSYATRGVLTAVGTAGATQYYLLPTVTGTISVKVLAYGLYSSVDPKVQILAADGVTIAGSSTDNVFSDSGGFVNYDASATATATGLNYYIKVTNNGDLSTTSNQYPAGAVGLFSGDGQIDSVLYYLMMVTINDSTTLVPSTASPILTNNARCEKSDSFSAFTDHGSPPGSSSSSSGGGGGGSSAAKSAGGCGGMIYDSSDHDHDGSGPGSNALFSAWGILAMLLMGRSLQQLARRYVAR